MLSVMVVWRMHAAIRVLRWGEVRDAYRSLPATIRVGIISIVLLIYYFAVWPPLVLLCLIILALLILAQPIDGLCLAAVTLPFYFQHKELDLGAVSLTIAPVLAASLCMLPALLVYVRRHHRPLDKWDWLAAAWVGIMVVSASSVWHWPAYWRGAMELAATPLILFWAARTFTHSGTDRGRVLGALVLGGTLLAAIGLWQWVQGGGTQADSVRRLVGTYFSANHASLYLERTLFVATGLALYHRTRIRWLYVLSIVTVFLALTLTASRGAMLLGLPAGIIIIGLYAMKR